LALEIRNLAVSEFHVVCQQISDVQQGQRQPATSVESIGITQIQIADIRAFF
jgi:hypothetical protein